jgi:Carboxypeptidase regulatory-like domain
MNIKYSLIVVLAFALLLGCKKSSEPTTTGIVSGTIKDASTSAVIPGVLVLVFDANTNAPTANSIFTACNGTYSFDLTPGSYYIKLSKLGYENLPHVNIIAVPFRVVLEQTVITDFEMNPLTTTDMGTISGQVTKSSNPATGVLVVASGTSAGYSSVTDKNGNYWIYNVPAGTYTVKAWESGYNSSSANLTLTSSRNLQNNNLTLTPGASGSVTGSITFLATSHIEVDVSLINPQTNETIPGLTTTTSNYNYTISNVPAGTYIARVSYENDGKVVDPDWILKNGEPTVTVGTSEVTMNFSVICAVNLTYPINDMASTLPYGINTTTPTFTWMAYSSTDDYVIEVSDVNGNVIWGGFGSSGTIKNITIPKTTTFIKYNIDGKATQALQNGHIYRWRIFASKNDNSDPRGWKIISVSEEQEGLIKVVL